MVSTAGDRRVVMVGSPVDPHLQRVARELERLGCGHDILDFTPLGVSWTLDTRVATGQAPVTTLAGPDGQVIDSTEIGALWLRRAYPPAGPESVPDPDDRAFARKEWRICTDALSAAVPAWRVFNVPGAERAASKVRQLIAATDLGFRIPETLIGSSAAAVDAFVDRHRGRVVHKALSAPRHAFLETRRWTETDGELLDLLAMAPTMVQEEIRGYADLRVTIAGPRTFTALIPAATGSATGAVDSRLDMSGEYRCHDLDRSTSDRLGVLMDRLGLAMATIDLKLLESGECVFFELNPQGQFLYVEIMTGLPVCAGVAATLAEVARQAG